MNIMVTTIRKQTTFVAKVLQPYIIVIFKALSMPMKERSSYK